MDRTDSSPDFYQVVEQTEKTGQDTKVTAIGVQKFLCDDEETEQDTSVKQQLSGYNQHNQTQTTNTIQYVMIPINVFDCFGNQLLY